MTNNHPKGYNAILNLLALYAEKVDLGDAKGTAKLFKNADVKWGSTARSYYKVIQQTNNLPMQVIAGGRYHDVFNTINDTWEFRRRDYFKDFRGDVSDHIIT